MQKADIRVEEFDGTGPLCLSGGLETSVARASAEVGDELWAYAVSFPMTTTL